ncbi:MAG: YjjG family noncanonical pyrimidine nucleotidase [Muribaculaceae bacterium]|nr:YjjG family noncanonical pyrimidine nucleotidase [Muribaculaceae bacterium]
MKWLFFDLDDTIWNFSANSAISLRKLYAISPILRKLFKTEEEFIDIYHENNSLLWDLYAKGKVTTEELKRERWRRTLATRQFEVLTAVCEELETTYLDILAEGTEKFQGMEEMLGELTKHCLIAVLSNGFSKTQYKKLQFSGLGKYITRTIVSEEIGINKPDIKLFEYAIQETGATPPFIMIGDHPETDILGALKAGWHAIWMNLKGRVFPFTPQALEERGINPSLYIGSATNVEELRKLLSETVTKI